MLLKVTLTLWLGAICTGFFALSTYQHTPGMAGSAPTLWPATSRISRASSSPSLIMLLHPRCSCSKASVNELESVLAHARNRVETFVLFSVPEFDNEAWRESALWQKVNALPGVNVIFDEGGREAELFGARTSGQVFVYNSDGALSFSGGITASRGHEGENAGQQALINFLNSKDPIVTRTPVFGCELVGPAAGVSKERYSNAI